MGKFQGWGFKSMSRGVRRRGVEEVKAIHGSE